MSDSARYTLTWSERATYRTEITVSNAEIASWANSTGIIRSTRHLNDPEYRLTAEDIAAMQAANPTFHRQVIALYANKTMVLSPAQSAIVAASGQDITEVHGTANESRHS